MKVLIALSLSVFILVGGTTFAADFNGDGTGDIAIYRETSGLWSVRGITRVYFGGSGADPVPGDYDGFGRDSIAIFRGSSGLWAVRDITRVYFGGSSDQAKPGDYDGDRTDEFAIFRPTTGMWAAKGITRVYYGSSGDVAISPGKYAWPVRGEIPVTGQTTVYQSGDDGSYQAGSPLYYQTWVAQGAQLTLDRNTGLTWASNGNAKGCSYGQQTDWNSAIDWCDNLSFGGYTDWRLPNVKELHSIADYGVDYPSIDSTYFPNTVSSQFWSSTTYSAAQSEFAWSIWFNIGTFDADYKTNPHYLRAVRGP